MEAAEESGRWFSEAKTVLNLWKLIAASRWILEEFLKVYILHQPKVVNTHAICKLNFNN